MTAIEGLHSKEPSQNFLLPHRKEAELPEHKDVEPLEKYRKFIPIYCEILKKIKKCDAPVYGCVERPGAKPYWPLTEQLMENMIITLEPCFEYLPGKMLVHEENILITDQGYELLSSRTPQEIPIIT